jgi:hypothetical protein
VKVGCPILARSVRKGGIPRSRPAWDLVFSRFRHQEPHLPALMKAPVVALITLMPFLSFSLVP